MLGLEHPTFRLRCGDVTTSPLTPYLIQLFQALQRHLSIGKSACVFDNIIFSLFVENRLAEKKVKNRTANQKLKFLMENCHCYAIVTEFSCNFGFKI